MFFRVIIRCIVFSLIVGKHSLIALAQLLGLRRLFHIIFFKEKPYERINTPIFIRRNFEDLGPAYIKLGQIIASSPGLFPERYSNEFKKLLDSVPPFSVVQAKAILDHELGRPHGEVFDNFDDEPLAAASIAQVHTADLKDGTHVVVKIQRPNIHDRVVADVWIMRFWATIFQKFSRQLQLSNVVGIIDDFHRTILEEMDFTLEGKNMDEFNTIIQKHGLTELCAPEVYSQYTTTQLLTMERFYGFKADDVDAIKKHNIDSEHFLRIGLRGWLLTLMLYGFFHGDVHAGNLMFLPESKRVGFLDFGIIGRFDKVQRMQVLKYLLYFITQDWHGLAKLLVEMGSAPEDVDLEAFSKDLGDTYSPLVSMNFASIKYQELLPNVTRTALTYGVSIPKDFILILKQLLYFDRYAKLTAPNLNVFGDMHLVDFLFTPEAMATGIDMNQIMPILQRVQQLQTQQKTAS